MDRIDRFIARRQALSAAFAGHALVIPSGRAKVRNGDVRYPFRPASDFYYLTGSQEPDAVLLMQPQTVGHDDVLFVAPRFGRDDTRFFTDSVHGELWTGGSLGLVGNQQRYGMHRTASLETLPHALQRLQIAATPYHVLRGFDSEVDAALVARPHADAALAERLGIMRLVKDDTELAALRRACAITAGGFARVLQAMPAARSERDLEAVFTQYAHTAGNDPGYAPVVAAGPHATVLHWTRGDGPLNPNQLLLLDLGAEDRSLYTADITRTLPMNGHFSAAQRQVYDAVLTAHAAALAAVKPGNATRAPHDAAMASLTTALVQMGILQGPASEVLQTDKQLQRRYTLHGVSHMLGLDVHDAGRAPARMVRDGQLQPNMVLTIEPGLYFQADDLTVPEALRGIGVRIEDDVRVTDDGYEILSDLPRRAADIEAWVQAMLQAADGCKSNEALRKSSKKLDERSGG